MVGVILIAFVTRIRTQITYGTTFKEQCFAFRELFKELLESFVDFDGKKENFFQLILYNLYTLWLSAVYFSATF